MSHPQQITKLTKGNQKSNILISYWHICCWFKFYLKYVKSCPKDNNLHYLTRQSLLWLSHSTPPFTTTSSSYYKLACLLFAQLLCKYMYTVLLYVFIIIFKFFIYFLILFRFSYHAYTICKNVCVVVAHCRRRCRIINTCCCSCC